MNVSIHAFTKLGQTDLGGHNNTVFITSTKRNKLNTTIDGLTSIGYLHSKQSCISRE